MSGKAILKMLVSGFLAVSLIAQPTVLAAPTLADRLEYDDNSAVSDILFDTYYYSDYIKDNSAENTVSGETVKLDLFNFTHTGTAPELRQDKERGQVLYWGDECTGITYKINVPKAGNYELYFDYYAIDGNSQSIARGVKIDGKYPFEESKNFFLRRGFVDSGDPKKNNLGDEVMPAQTEIKKWNKTAVFDNNGMYHTPLTFVLSAGEHTVTIEYINQPVLIAEICFTGASDIPTYSEIQKQYKEKGYKSATESVRFEAEDRENILSKSESSILIASDSDSTMTPKAITSKKFNYIGGGTWNGGGESVSWRFTTKQSGLYKIAFRSVQNANAGMPSSRRIEIDGKVPFAEVASYNFEYSPKWQTNTLSDGDKPYLFYLEEGEHTLTVTAVNGKMTDIIHKVTEANSMLSNAYQNIVMVTGQSPDVNYDYELDKSIPSLEGSLQDIVDVLDECIKQLKKATNDTATLENSIRQVKSTIEGYRDDMDAIPTGLADFTSALTNMGDWLSTLQTQFLAVDYIELAPENKELDDPRQSFIDRFVSAIRNLILSYTKDYNAIGSINDSGEGTKELEVWLSKSKEWAEILKDLADGEFAAQNNVNLKMNMLPEGAFSGVVNTLLLAVNAGNEPDVVLNMDPTNTVEYAVRGAIYDLNSFKDFNDVKGYTIEELYKPISYDGGVFGLPETMGFKVIIYRTDVFEKLHIDVPNTWDEVYNDMLPKLYQYNLQMYVPQDFTIFLFQKGGQYYNAEGTKSALDSDSAFMAFEQFIGNYNDYGFPYNISFYNRFRTGEVPIGIGTMAEYLTVSYGAPELSGKWAIAPIPATVQEDGSLNRTFGGGIGTTSVIMSTAEDPELAWEFLKWWTDSETQSEYGRRLESILGLSARWSTANIEAFKTLPWSTSDLKVITQSFENIRETPYVPGGYFTTRHMTNAIARCITGNYTPRESLEETVEQINIELERKRADLGKNKKGEK